MTCHTSAGARAVTAGGRSWHAVLGACLHQLEPLPADANLGIVYLSEALAPMADDIVRALRERTGVRDWLGACGDAVLGGPGGASADGLAVLVTSLPEAGFRISPSPSTLPARMGLLLAHAELGEGEPTAILSDLARHGARSVVGGLAAAADRRCRSPTRSWPALRSVSASATTCRFSAAWPPPARPWARSTA